MVDWEKKKAEMEALFRRYVVPPEDSPYIPLEQLTASNEAFKRATAPKDGQHMIKKVDADIFIVSGDIHGNPDALKQVYEAFIKVTAENPDKRVVLVGCGDYCDRGNGNAEVLLLLRSLVENYPENVVLLRGNHDGSGQMYSFDRNRFDAFSEFVKRFGLEETQRNADALGVGTASTLFEGLAPCLLGFEDGRLCCSHAAFDPSKPIWNTFERGNERTAQPAPTTSNDVLTEKGKEDRTREKSGRNVKKASQFGANQYLEFMKRNGIPLSILGHEHASSGIVKLEGEVEKRTQPGDTVIVESGKPAVAFTIASFTAVPQVDNVTGPRIFDRKPDSYGVWVVKKQVDGGGTEMTYMPIQHEASFYDVKRQYPKRPAT
jgi:metallophosphoesterase superfamily enzyme